MPDGPLDVAQVRALQEAAARATPAAVQERRAGCWLRQTDSPTTWWAGAALLHDTAADDLAAAITAAETFYAAHGAPARFQVCPACPRGLDDALTGRGYVRTGDISLLVAAADEVARRTPQLRTDVTEHLTEHLTDDWLRLLMAAQGIDTDQAPERRMLQRVDRPSAYVTAHLEGRPVAVGRAVADSGRAGVFAMATLPTARRSGAGRAVLAALAGWAGQHGAPNLYLQVTSDSAAARSLYARAGFREAATYHYRAASTSVR